MITCPERDCNEPGRVADVHPRRKPDLDRLAARTMRAVQAPGQRCGVLCNHQTARAEKEGPPGARQVSHPAIPINGNKLGGSAVGAVGGNHEYPRTRRAARFGNPASITSTTSAAESSGRLNVIGSASGIAKACSGVSMSPGSIERKRTPSIFPSSAQIAVKWRRAALLAPYAPHPE